MAKTLPRNRSSATQAGFALIEVLVSLLFLAFGMLGIAAMILVGNKANSSSYLKQQAVQSAYDIVDRMHANPAQVASYALGPPQGTVADCYAVACSAAQVAIYDLSYWYLKDLAQIPNGTGTVVVTPHGAKQLITVTVQWDDKPAQAKLGAVGATATTGANLAQFSVQTLL